MRISESFTGPEGTSGKSGVLVAETVPVGPLYPAPAGYEAIIRKNTEQALEMAVRHRYESGGLAMYREKIEGPEEPVLLKVPEGADDTGRTIPATHKLARGFPVERTFPKYPSLHGSRCMVG
jgi:hypothetical protein